MLKTVGNPSTRFGNQTVVDGNIVIGTAGYGIDFSADPSAPGMTSELLDDYEEGTFTATLTASTPPTSAPISTGHYTKIGRLVTVMTTFTNVDTTGASGTYFITGLPFAAANNGAINYGTVSSFQFSTETAVAAVVPNTSQIELAPTYSASLTTAAAGGGKYVRATVSYIAA